MWSLNPSWMCLSRFHVVSAWSCGKLPENDKYDMTESSLEWSSFSYMFILPVLAPGSPSDLRRWLLSQPPFISQGLARPPFSHQDYLRSALSDVSGCVEEMCPGLVACWPNHSYRSNMIKMATIGVSQVSNLTFFDT